MKLIFALALLLATVAQAEEISAEELRDKIRGGMIGQIIGNLNGLPHEMKYIDAPGEVLTYTPSLPDGAFTDDDTDIEWVHLFEMDRAGVTMLPYARITELWKKHINRGIWTANAYARRLIDLGIEPPLTGRIEISPVAVFNISGQFCAESYGLVAPLMPQTAAKIGLHYTHITIDGEPAQQTQMFTTMVALAFRENEIDRLLDAGEQAIDPQCVVSKVVKDTRAWCAQHPGDWRATRKLIHDKYTLHNNELPDKNGYHLNTASIVAGMIYGKGDFAETMRMVFNFGWDSDCNAATAGTILGVIKGGKWIDAQGWTIKSTYENRRRDGMPMDETIDSYSDRVFRNARRIVVENGGEDQDEKLTIRAQRPANVETLPKASDRLEELRMQLLPAIEKDLTGDETARARSAYLAICLGEAPRLARERAKDFAEAKAELQSRRSLLAALFKAPPSVAKDFQDRFLAAGIEKPAGELLKSTTKP